jgi:hypothetical protein
MVLDVKALSWAAQNNIDTAKLKAARIPIYGKWYFPELPPSTPLVNLETGEVEVFPERMLAGEVVWAPLAELRRASLLPAEFAVPPAVETAEEPTHALHTIAAEPLLAIARPPGVDLHTSTALVPAAALVALPDESEPPPSGIHMPSASIAPFVLGVGFCLAFLGLITNVAILVAGLAWMLAGAIVWIRIGLLEAAHAPTAHAGEGEPRP